MMPCVIPLLQQHRAQIEALCRLHQVKRLDLIGSAANGTFDPDKSDFDFIVEFEPLGWKGSSKRYFGLLHGLEDLLQRKVDLVERPAITNSYFLQVADKDRELLYAA
jgi:uncharacterized protein